MRQLIRLAGAATAAMLTACGHPPEPDPRIVGEWIHALYGAIRVERMSPPVASRIMAYATTALYGGFAAASPGLAQPGGSLNSLAEVPRAAHEGATDGALVAIEAERVVLDSLLVDGLATTKSAVRRLADSLAGSRSRAGVRGAVRDSSTRLGRALGLAIVAWSATDGFDSTRKRPPWVPPRGPGLWVNDAPATIYAAQNLSGASEMVVPGNPANQLRAGNTGDRALILSRPKPANPTLPAVNMAGITEPYWGTLRPFVLRRWDECEVPPPPPWSADPASALYQDAAGVRATRAALTDEQRAIAFFWADNAGESGTPVGHWLAIASQIASARRLRAHEAARVAMLTAVAQADAFIASWGYKFRHNLIRPRTMIRRLMDPAWEPLIPTPPFPEYPSGHSTQSAAASTVLTQLLGDGAFDDSTGVTLGHRVRRFASFTAASDEAGQSRIYGGIHFTAGNLGGRALGQCVGRKVLARFGVKSAS